MLESTLNKSNSPYVKMGTIITQGQAADSETIDMLRHFQKPIIIVPSFRERLGSFINNPSFDNLSRLFNPNVMSIELPIFSANKVHELSVPEGLDLVESVNARASRS